MAEHFGHFTARSDKRNPTDTPVVGAVPSLDEARNPVSNQDRRVGLSSILLNLSVDRTNTLMQKDNAGATLNNAGILNVSGNYVWIPYTTNITDFFMLQIGDRDPVIVQAGTSVIGMDFEKLVFFNAPIAAAQACIAWGFTQLGHLRFG